MAASFRGCLLIIGVPEICFCNTGCLGNFCNFAANQKNMATYTITVNERTSTGKALLALIKSLGVLVKPVRPTTDSGKSLTLNAIREAKEGKGVYCEDFDDYLKKVHE